MPVGSKAGYLKKNAAAKGEDKIRKGEWKERNSTWTDVRDLLSGYGVDLAHNRFCILQGEFVSHAI